MTQTDTCLSTAVTEHDEGLKDRQEYRDKTLHCLVCYNILMKDFSASFPTPLCKAFTKRRGTYSTLILYSSSKLWFFSLRPLSSNFGCNAGKLQNVSNNVIQVMQGTKLTFSFVSAAWASASSPSSDTLSLGCKRCQIQLGQGVERQKCCNCTWSGWIQRHISDNLGANTHLLSSKCWFLWFLCVARDVKVAAAACATYFLRPTW